MDVETAGIHRVLTYPRNSAVSSESGIELSQLSTEQPSPNYRSAENLWSSDPCISPYVDSRLFSGTRNENARTSDSSVTSNLNTDCDPRQKFSWIISKLVRNPWTESTEFKELWSDIPTKSVNRNPVDDQEQKLSENDGTSASNVMVDSKIDSSIPLAFRKYPWTASTEFVELWSDIPSEFDASCNLCRDKEQLKEQNIISSTHVTVPLQHVYDCKQYPATVSESCRNSWTESVNHPEIRYVVPQNSICSNYPEQDRVASYRQFSKCFVIVLVVQILLSLVPVSAIYMGAVHIGTCPANEVATFLVYIAGFSGLFLGGCHIAYQIVYHFIPAWAVTIRLLLNIFQLITGILLVIEMIIFYSMSPSFENSEDYCDKTFYNYTFYMNFAATGIVFLSVLLQNAFSKHQVNNETF